jgi:hypothetical protein
MSMIDTETETEKEVARRMIDAIAAFTELAKALGFSRINITQTDGDNEEPK